MKYYQTVTTLAGCGDEWISYEGYDRAKAVEVRDDENSRNAKNTKQRYTTEVREYTVPEGKRFEDMSDAEQCDVLSAYDVV